MINEIRKLNPNLKIYEVSDKEFNEYGRVVCMDTAQIIKEAEKIEYPDEGSLYLPSVREFEDLAIAEEITDKIFGTLDTQVGYCFGYNSYLNATEWHHSSELNIAVRPLILILGKRENICQGKMNSSDMKAFYLPKGTAVEVFATSTHFCPCQVQEGGFGCVVALPRGTNVSLDKESSDPLLFRKNKWIICHEGNTALINRGVVPGIYGENTKINFRREI